jgi:hypothetical protein
MTFAIWSMRQRDEAGWGALEQKHNIRISHAENEMLPLSTSPVKIRMVSVALTEPARGSTF